VCEADNTRTKEDQLTLHIPGKKTIPKHLLSQNISCHKLNFRLG